jgi:hypothetical protein
MTPRTPQCEVFWALLLSSKHSGVPEDSKFPTFPSVGLHPHTWPKWGCDRLPTCWLTQVDERLLTYNLCINSDQLPPCARLKQLAERQYIVHHQVAAADSSRVKAYLGLKSSAQYGYKEYLSRVDNAQLKRSLACFHCANHKLQIELGRQAKPMKVRVQ